MSDFDEVLERLVTDPQFQAALRADPSTALAGYQLDPQERAVREAQLDQGAGPDRTVEARISKSGLAGMIGPVASAFGLDATEPGGHPVQSAYGPAPDDPAVGIAFGEVHATGAYGAPDPHSAGLPAADYHTWVDAGGDGSPDAYRAVERGDGGVDIEIDQDGDGRVDFVGHDYDRDGLVDDADYDTDRDGVLDTRMTDVTGDGWLDESAPLQHRGYAAYCPAPDPGA